MADVSGRRHEHAQACGESSRQGQLLARERFYIPALDGVRFLAFFLVFLHHLPPGDVFRGWSPGFSAVIQRVSTFGWIGVDLFLTLSGFLIATLLLREVDATGAVSVGRFYVRRALRIWPLYYLALFTTLVVTPVLFGQFGSPAYRKLLAEHLFPYATLFGNLSYGLLSASVDALSPSSDTLALLWTVTLEEQFYLIFPLAVLAAGPAIRLRPVISCAIALVAFSAATRFYIQANGFPYPLVWVATLAHLDPLVLGAVGAVAWRKRARLSGIRTYGAEVPLALGAWWVVASFPQIGRSQHTIWQIGLVAVGALLLLVAVLRYRPLRLVFAWRPVAWLGRISYGLYVYHILARHAYQHVLVHALPVQSMPFGPVRFVVEFSLIMVVTVVFAAASYYAFERPFLTLKERFTIVASRPI